MTYFNAVKFIRSAPHSEGDGRSLVAMLARLGNPQRRIKYIRLAGSNGKTVCAEMLMSVLGNSGYNVGCLRMPVREDPRENICIRAGEVSIDDFCYAVALVKTELEALRKEEGEENAFLSSGEILLCTALIVFRRLHCDVSLIESDHFGDDPSLVLPPPFAAVICGTIPSSDNAEISRIRSYICRGTEEIVSAPQDSDAYKIIFDTCYDVGCRLTLPSRAEIDVKRLSFGGADFAYKGENYSISLCGRFQVLNAVLALEVIEMLVRKGFSIGHDSIAEGLRRLRLPAKVEAVSLRPLIIVDSTHTPIAVRTVCDSVAELEGRSGRAVRLCMPSAELAGEYILALADRGYTLEKVILPAEQASEELGGDVIYAKNAKQLASSAIKELSRDTMLIISGNYPFVNALRRHLLDILGF